MYTEQNQLRVGIKTVVPWSEEEIQRPLNKEDQRVFTVKECREKYYQVE